MSSSGSAVRLGFVWLIRGLALHGYTDLQGKGDKRWPTVHALTSIALLTMSLTHEQHAQVVAGCAVASGGSSLIQPPGGRGVLGDAQAPQVEVRLPDQAHGRALLRRRCEQHHRLHMQSLVQPPQLTFLGCPAGTREWCVQSTFHLRCTVPLMPHSHCLLTGRKPLKPSAPDGSARCTMSCSGAVLPPSLRVFWEERGC